MTEPTWIMRAGFDRDYAGRVLQVTGFSPSSHWRFSEITGTTANDVSGANNGTYTGGFTLGRRGLALGDLDPAVELNGSTGYVAVSDVYNFINQNSFTVSALVKLDALPAVAARIVDKMSATNGWNIRVLSTGAVHLSRYDAAGIADSGEGPSLLIPGRTYHVVGTYDGAFIRVYVDGVAGTPVASTRLVPGNSAILNIGRNPIVGQYLDGVIDEVMIWFGNPLSDAIAAALAEAALGRDVLQYFEGVSQTLSVARGQGKERVQLNGELRIRVNNRTGDWTPGNTASPFYSKLGTHVPIMVAAVLNGEYFDLWRGFIVRTEPSFVPRNVSSPMVDLTCRSLLSVMLDREMIGILYQGGLHTPQSAIDRLLDYGLTGGASVSGQYQDLDNINTSFKLNGYWCGIESMLANLDDIAECSLGGKIWETKDGTLRYKRANFFLHTTPPYTWGDGTSIKPTEVRIDPGQDMAAVRLRLSFNYFRGAAGTVVYTNPRGSANSDSHQINNYDQYMERISLANPVDSIIQPVATTDYLANSLKGGGGTNRTATMTVSCDDGTLGIEGGGGGTYIGYLNGFAGIVYLTFAQLRGTSIIVTNNTQVFEEDLPRTPRNLPRTFTNRAQSLSLRFLESSILTYVWAHWVWHRNQWPVPIYTLSFDWTSDAIRANMLRLELHDMVLFDDRAELVSSKTNEWLRVIGIDHRITIGGVHRTIVRLIPSWYYVLVMSDVAATQAVFDRFLTGTTANLDVGPTGLTWLSLTTHQYAGANGAQSTGAAGAVAINHVDIGFANHQVFDRVSAAHGALANQEYGILFRFSNGDNYWRATYYNNGDGKVRLVKRVVGVETEVGTAEIPLIAEADRAAWDVTLTIVQMVWLRVIAQGNRIRVYVNLQPEPVIDVTDSALNTNTKVGIYSTGTTAYHKNFAAVAM